MTKPLFNGACTALITPFTENGIDLPAFEKLIENQVQSGIQALVVLGTTGEPATMTAQEKKLAIECCVSTVSGRVPVIAGAGSNNTAAAAEAAVLARTLKADAVLAVTPYYNKCTPKGLHAHYEAIASAGLPVIIYNVPGRTGLNITPAVLESLSDISGLVAIKEASGSIDQLTDMLSRCGDRFTFYSGEDGLTLPMLALGAQGVISVASNILPADMQKLCELFFSGEVAQAAQLQIKLYPLIKALFCEVNPIPVKTAASLMGICSLALRLPLTQMEESNRARLVAAMREYGINI